MSRRKQRKMAARFGLAYTSPSVLVWAMAHMGLNATTLVGALKRMQKMWEQVPQRYALGIPASAGTHSYPPVVDVGRGADIDWMIMDEIGDNR